MRFVDEISSERDETSLREHLSAALDAAEDEDVTYHIRAAQQKLVVDEWSE